MTDGMAGKVALITGAGRGIGSKIAIEIARHGSAVVLTARTESEISQVAAQIRASGGRALAHVCDVTKEADVNACVDAAISEFGKVDILINNAGHNVLGAIHEQDSKTWWNQIEVNLGGTYFFSRAVIAKMIERKWGRIVNISSVQGKRGEKFVSAYCSAKHAVIGLTRALAMEVADKGITVNAVCPGYVQTKLTEGTMKQRAANLGVPVEKVIEKVINENIPQKTVIQTEDVAEAVLFLLSDGAKRITGESMNVSGGLIMH